MDSIDDRWREKYYDKVEELRKAEAEIEWLRSYCRATIQTYYGKRETENEGLRANLECAVLTMNAVRESLEINGSKETAINLLKVHAETLSEES